MANALAPGHQRDPNRSIAVPYVEDKTLLGWLRLAIDRVGLVPVPD